MAPRLERPSLAGLPLKRKLTAVLSPSEAAPLAQPSAPPAAEEKDGKVPVMVRMTRADRKIIRQIAIGIDTTVQALIEDAIHDIIRRHRGALHL